MSHNFLKYDQEQQHLLPKSITDWIEENSLERLVSDTIDYLDTEGRLEPFYPELRKDGRGRPSYHPVMVLKVLVFGYSIGVRSSRKLDRLLERDIVFRYLAANQQPDFRTISDFRKDNREEFELLFEEIQEILDEATAIDDEEDKEYGPQNRGDELPEELREQEDRLTRLRAAKERLDTEELLY